MKLLVTGGAGYIGSVVAELSVAAGHDVVVLDDLRAGSRAAVPPACTLVVGALGDAAALARCFALGPFDAVLHLAAEAAIEASVTDPALYFRVNLADSLALLDAMRAHGVDRLVFSSTAATYGEPVTTPIDEEHPQRPINAYGESKLMFETCVRWYHRAYGLRAVSFRYFNAAGATAERGEARPHETHLLPLVLDATAGRRPPVQVFGNDYPTPDGTCVRDYVHVVDIARAHLLALHRIDSLGLAWFNIGSESGYSVRQVIDAVEQTLGRPVPWVPADRRRGDPAVLVASAGRVREQLGWVPEHAGLQSIVESAWLWRQRHPDGYPVMVR
ncbi:MAG TPA: UDP-glucose 4-epimerase GalE [Vicinamibacterales bacterium]|nr:UDP-glucose 4-epimerase GalE [Vicinamibacterales bacterium]